MMENEVLCSAKFIRCEILDARPSALDYVIQDITHELTDSVMCELEKGELICSLQNVEQDQLSDINSVKIRRKVMLTRLVRCRDCKYYQAYTESGVTKGYGFCVVHGMSPSVEEFYCADGEVKQHED